MRGIPLLVLLAVAVFGAFTVQRARSSFLTIESESDLALEVAAKTGLEVSEVMALRELRGLELSAGQLLAVTRAFAEDRAALGERLAVLAAQGQRSLAERLLREADGDPVRAETVLRALPEAIGPVRFAAMRERFASRRP